MSFNLTKKIKQTQELTPIELLNLFKERVRVFVVEQECAYQEVDEQDVDAIHVWFEHDGQLVAYARIIEREQDVTFGRVLVHSEYRGHKLGQKLVAEVLNTIDTKYPGYPVQIQAQSYLENFYESFGFKTISEEYLEDNIPHKDMLLEK